jgi:hypothetical protein
MLRSFLLALCLLVCLACATPLPIENLEEGMTTEAVREEFGEPEAINEWRGVVDRGREAGKTRFTFPKGTNLKYTHEEQDWGGTAYCTLFAPLCALMSPLTWLVEGETVYPLVGVDERSVDLNFLENKLDHWVLSDAPTEFSTGQDTMPPGMMTLSEWTRDSQYHYHRGDTHRVGDIPH